MAISETTLHTESSSDTSAAWWNDNWEYRTTIRRAVPWQVDGNVPMEARADLQKLIDEAAVGGSVDYSSLRVVQRSSSNGEGTEVPAASRESFDADAQRCCRYLTWLARAQAGHVGVFDIYFNLQGSGSGSSRSELAEAAPAENLLHDACFTNAPGTAAAKWKLDAADIASFSAISGGGLRIQRGAPAGVRQKNAVCISQRIDVRDYAGQHILLEADLLAERGVFGKAVTVEINQYREDGSEIYEYAVDPRWLTVELAQDHKVQFSERGQLNPQAAEVQVNIRLWLDVVSSWFGEKPAPEQLDTSIRIDRVLMRAGELLPWPQQNTAMFTQGALKDAQLNRAVSLTGERRFVFNGASAGALQRGDFNPDKSADHWAAVCGTLEFYVKPNWQWDDGCEHMFYEAFSRNNKTCLHSSLIKRAADTGNRLEFCIADASGQMHTISGCAQFLAGNWHHIALTWDHSRAHLQMYMDGKLIAAAGPEQESWPCTLDPADPHVTGGMGLTPGDKRSIPMQICFGGDILFQHDAVDADIDELRISDVVRYQRQFTPAYSSVKVDQNTRALFRFENTCKGVHHGDDCFVDAFFIHSDQPQLESVTLEHLCGKRINRRDVVVNPYASEQLFQQNRAETVTQVSRPAGEMPDPRFIELRHRCEKRVVTATGKQPPIAVGGDLSPVMRWEAYSHLQAEAATAVPRWRANGNVVPFSYQTLCQTLASGQDDEVAKATEVFKYVQAVTRYYHAPVREYVADRVRAVRYSLIRMLNIYPMHQCGPLNYPLRKAFLLMGISSNDYSGTGHQFQQAFYRGSHRLYDMSKRVYWLNRDNRSVCGMRQVHDDPWLLVRAGKGFKAYLPGRPACARFIDTPVPVERDMPTVEAYREAFQPRVPHRIDLALRVDEKAWLGWHNEGRWLRRNRKDKPLSLGLVPPEYGNGALLYEPSCDATAAKMDNLDIAVCENVRTIKLQDAAKGGAMLYELLCPYLLTGAHVSGSWKDAAPGSLRLMLCADGTGKYQQVWTNDSADGFIDADLSEHIAGRYDYSLKIEIDAGSDAAELRDLSIRSALMCSHLSAPGKLKLGDNTIEMVAGPVEQPVTAELAWTERYRSDLGLEVQGLSYYAMSDEYYRRLLIAEPGSAQKITVSVLGRSFKGELAIEGLPTGWGECRKRLSKQDGETAKAEFDVNVGNAEPGSIVPLEVVACDGKSERRARVTMLIAQPAIVAELEDSPVQQGMLKRCASPLYSGGACVQFEGEGELGVDLDAPHAGRYVAWLRARYPAGSSQKLRLKLGEQPYRDLDVISLNGLRDWQAPDGAYTKLNKYEKTCDPWAWYRITSLELEAGCQRLLLASGKGAAMDSLIVVPEDRAHELAMTQVTQNWNYEPWDCPY